jgi:hypothetical protein
MRIVKQIRINDEPWTAVDTGKRTATLVYQGPKYLYLEYDSTTDKVLQLTHIAESTPDLAGALEKLTPIEGRSIVEINAETSTTAASYFWDHYELIVTDYVENLENGETYTYAYSSPSPKLGEIFDFYKMTWGLETGDFDEYKFMLPPVSESEMTESINSILAKVQESLANNTSLSASDKTSIEAYIVAMNKFKADMAAGVESWKMAFPICSIPY